MKLNKQKFSFLKVVAPMALAAVALAVPATKLGTNASFERLDSISSPKKANGGLAKPAFATEEEARAAAEELNIQLTGEGSVLLKNKASALPLAKATQKVTVFGSAATSLANGTGHVDGALKDGGFKSVEEADKEVMSLYRQYKGNPEKDFSTASCTSENGSGCQVPSQDNCTTFSAWFIKTFLGWDTRVVQNYPGGAMGYALAGNIYKAYHDKYPELKMSNTPTPYSIASWNSSMPSPSGSSNHTAIILGVDVGNDNVIVGEAGWANHSFMGVHDKNYGSGYKLSKMKGKGIYVDFSAYVKNLQSS